ncbi:MAG: hypothetical protein IJB53_02620 [Mailhella sp.]|nr:hypothetical protein [Mailhella sp.]
MTRAIPSKPTPEGLRFDVWSDLTFHSLSKFPFFLCLLFLQDVPPDVHYGEAIPRKLTVYPVLTSFPFRFPTLERVLFPIQDEGVFLPFCFLFLLILLPLILKHGLGFGARFGHGACPFFGVVTFLTFTQFVTS